VELVDTHKLRAWQNRVHGAAAIFSHCCAVIT
jgi:hypothetical protein